MKLLNKLFNKLFKKEVKEEVKEEAKRYEFLTTIQTKENSFIQCLCYYQKAEDVIKEITGILNNDRNNVFYTKLLNGNFCMIRKEDIKSVVVEGEPYTHDEEVS